MTNIQFPMTNQPPNPKFDLSNRTSHFGVAVIEFCKTFPKTEITRPLILQLVRSGTSIGANYAEADDAESKKDFEHKIGVTKKEAKETRYWLNLINETFPEYQEKTLPLLQESKELVLIFSAIIRKSKGLS